MSEDRTDAVIEAIDGALEDWSVSPDAMRWTPEPPQPTATPGRLSWLGEIRVVEDPAVAPGDAILTTNYEREPFYDGTLVPVRYVTTSATMVVAVRPGLDEERREEMMRLIASAYDVPLCLAAGHRWGPEELIVGVDMDRASDTVHGVDQYRQTCTRCNQVAWRLGGSWTWTLGG